MKNPKENLEKYKDTSVQFLEADFKQCFEQMRHYDTGLISICKFSFLGYSTITGISIGLYKFGIENKIDLNIPSGIILCIALAIGFMFYAIAIRNRVYFVKVSRYVNEIRSCFMKNKPMGIINMSEMYSDYKKPTYCNFFSSQVLFCYILAFLNTILLGALLYVFLWNKCRKTLVIVVPFIFLGIQLAIALVYLKYKDYKSEKKWLSNKTRGEEFSKKNV